MIEFRAPGYIEVWRGDTFISRHRVEREAIESIAAAGAGEYELRFPTVYVIAKIPITKPSAPELGTPTVVSTTALTVPLARASTGPTSLEEYVLERRVYGGESFTEVARGAAIFPFADSGLTAATRYEYRAYSTDTTQRQSEYSAPVFGTTASATTVNPPENVAATSVATGIEVSWSAPSSGTAPDSYEIQRTYAADGAWSVKTTQAGTSYTDTDVAEGVAKWYRIVAIAGANRSDYSATVTAVGGASASTGAKNWLPGHGIKVQDDTGGTTASLLAAQQGKFSKMTEIDEFEYAEIRFRWGRLNTTGSTYDWSPLESNLEAARALGKKCAVGLNWKSFANGTSFLCPSDLTATAIATSSGYTMPMWREATMDRFIAFIEAFAAIYDGDDRIMFVTWAESSSSLTSPFPADYSRSALATQLKRLYAAASEAFTNTVVCAAINSLSGELVELLESAYQAGLGLYTPDAFDSLVASVFRGETSAEGTPYRDYRGLMASASVASQPVLGGKDDNGPPSNVINWAQINDVTHLSWYVTGDLPSPNDWASIKSAIEADPLLYTACPTNHAGGCVTF